jgi:YVTN family beta-propeller protein
LYSIALVSTALVLMLVSIAGTSPFAYITNQDSDIVSVIDTEPNKITATVSVGNSPSRVAVSPDGTKVYATNWSSSDVPSTVSVIDTNTNKVISTVNVGIKPEGVVVTPDEKKVYMANEGSNVYVIDTATNKVTNKVKVGYLPNAFGKFIGGNIQKAKLNGSKAEASLSKHKQKNHSKYNKAEKITNCKVDKNSWISTPIKWKQ